MDEFWTTNGILKDQVLIKKAHSACAFIDVSESGG